MGGLREQIERRIRQQGGGWVFSRKDLRDIASSGPAGVILSRLVKCGTIRRIGRGLYDTPRKSRLLKECLPPDVEQTVQAIARKHQWTIAPEGAMAANLLGLSRQVPARIVYLSDGPTRTLKAGGRAVVFRHAGSKDLRMTHYSSRLVAQALRFLGRAHVDDQVIQHLRRRLSAKDRARFLRDARYATDWIFESAQRIARPPSHG